MCYYEKTKEKPVVYSHLKKTTPLPSELHTTAMTALSTWKQENIFLSPPRVYV
jgi:hypothetical protein